MEVEAWHPAYATLLIEILPHSSIHWPEVVWLDQDLLYKDVGAFERQITRS